MSDPMTPNGSDNAVDRHIMAIITVEQSYVRSVECGTVVSYLGLTASIAHWIERPPVSELEIHSLESNM